MALSKATRTGLLLLITGGPFLVFLFLFIFGKNQYELDTYPFQLEEQHTGEIKLLLPPSENMGRVETDQWKRVENFFAKINSRPKIQNMILDSVNPSFRFWSIVDTIVPIQTAKGPNRKRLPGKPRLFLLDKQNLVRGVYSLSDPLSVDTLMIEYSVLTN